MKRKAGFIYLICLTIVLTIGFPSCEGPDYIAIRDIRQINFTDLASYQSLTAPAVTSSDSILMDIELEFVSFSDNYLPGTMTEAWGFSPPDPIMANEISAIRIFCDKPIYGISNGINLADQPQFKYGYERESLAEYISELARKDNVGYFNSIMVYIYSKPAPDQYSFIVELEDNNGHVFTGMKTLHWQ